MSCNHLIQFRKFLSIAVLFGQVLSFDGNTTRMVDITMQRLVVSEQHPNSMANYQQLKIHKFNRTTQILKGEFEVFIDLDNSFSISCTAYKKAGNQWKTTPFRIAETKFCDWVKLDTIFMEEMVKRAGLPPRGSCPAVPKVSIYIDEGQVKCQVQFQGKYYMADWPISTVNVPPYFNGQYWINEKLSKNGTVVSENDIYIEITQFDRYK